MKKIFTLFLISLLAVSAAIAQRLITEDFNYNAGQLTDSAGGANVSGGKWTPNTGNGKFIQVVTGDLSYAGYGTNPLAGSGRILLDSTTSTAEDAYTSFDSVNGGATIYCSFLLQLDYTDNLFKHDTAIGDYFIGLFSATSSSSYNARLYIRKGIAPNTFNLGIAAQAASSTPIGWVETDLPTGSTHLVTVGYTFFAGPNNDLAKLWIDETTPNILEPPAHASSKFSSGTEPANLGRFAVRQSYVSGKGGTPKCQIDAIKVSTYWLDATLPLQLKSLSVTNRNGFAGLSWQTCNEINVKHFEIQKSADAINFATVATVNARNTGCATSYNFNDAKALSGTAYYRLKMVDFDGRSSLSAIVSITGKLPVSISVFPNPVSSNLVVTHPKALAGASLQVVGLDGKPLMLNKITQDAVQTSINISKLANGNYMAVFTNGNETQTIRFVKQ